MLNKEVKAIVDSLRDFPEDWRSNDYWLFNPRLRKQVWIANDTYGLEISEGTGSILDKGLIRWGGAITVKTTFWFLWSINHYTMRNAIKKWNKYYEV